MRGEDHATEIAREWARLGPFGALDKMGVKYRKAGREAFVCCPWHGEKNASCTVAIGQEGTIRVHCFACSQTWDAHGLFGQLNGIDPRTSFPALLLHEAEALGRWDLVDALEGKAERRPMPPRKATQEPDPEPERTPPQREEVLGLLVVATMTAGDSEVAAWIASRGLSANDVDVRGLAFALPKDARLPKWAQYRKSSWVELGHRLLVPLYGSDGQVVSVRAGRVIEGDSPKRLPPSGHTCRGVVMADALGVELLKTGTWPSWAADVQPSVVIAEGEPDWLTWAVQSPIGSKPERAVFGIFSGAWTPEIAARIPRGARVAVWTDCDMAGHKYAKQIADSLLPRCDVFRRAA